MVKRRTAKYVLSKKKVLDMDYLNFVLETAVSSCQFGFIKEYQGKRKFHMERANTNVILALPLGAGKTTALLKISNAILVDDVTFPGMVGSINKMGEFVPGATIKAAGKVLLLDEFNKVPGDVKNAMNNLLEQRAYPRNLGFKVLRPVTSKKKFCEIKVKDNYIYVKSRFSCIASTMFLGVRESNRMSDIAWFTRFIPVRFIPDIDYYKKLLEGKKALTLNPRVVHVDVFDFKRYLKANDLYWEFIYKYPRLDFFEKKPFQRGALPRMFQNTVRLAAFIASLSKRSNISIKDFEKAMRFLPMMLSNYIFASLSEHESTVLEKYNRGMNQDKIADVIGITQQAISKVLTKLRMKGLIAPRK